VLGVLALGVSRGMLIAWQWERVDVTDSTFSILAQGLRSDLMTLGLFAAPILVLLPPLLLIGRVTWWVKVCCAWLGVSLVAIIFLEFATPQFLIEYDSRPNRLFLEYLVYPREVLAMLWNGYRYLLLLTAAGVAGLSWAVARHFSQYVRDKNHWRKRTVLLLWPLVVGVMFVMVRSSFQHRPANLATFAFCDDAMVNSLVANSAYSVLSAAYGLKQTDVTEVYERPEPSADLLAEGGLDAMVMTGGPPLGVIADLARRRPIRLLPIAGPEAEALIAKVPFFAQEAIPAGLYDGVAAEVPALSVGAIWLVAERIAEPTVYEITRALWQKSTLDLLAAGHPRGKEVSIDGAARGLGVPLHPGAARYYAEHAVLSLPTQAKP